MGDVTSNFSASARVNARAGRFELAAVITERHASAIGAARNPNFDIVRQITAFGFSPKVVTGSLSSANIEGGRLTSVGFGKSQRDEAVKDLGAHRE